MKLQMHCQGCDHKFNFQHPAITNLQKLARISINCPNCKVRIMQDFSTPILVQMIPLQKVVGH